VGKLFEKILFERIYNFFVVNNILTSFQNAYIKNRNTERGIFQLVSEVLRALNSSKYVAGLYLDLSRAFDSVDPTILFSKLWDMGLRGKAHELIKSYMTNRQQCVKMVDCKGTTHFSDYEKTKRGVPQGSILGPLLFIAYMNNLPRNVDMPVVLYADDTSVVCSNEKKDSLVEVIENTLKQLNEWFYAHQLTLNMNKTELVTFTASNIPFNLEVNYGQETNILSSKESTKFLGVVIDQNLKWKRHIDSLAPRVATCSYILRALRTRATLETCFVAYYGYLYPILKYGMVFWGRSTGIERLFLLQKRCIRSVFNLKRRDSCKPYFQEYGILTLVGIYIMESVLFLRGNFVFF